MAAKGLSEGERSCVGVGLTKWFTQNASKLNLAGIQPIRLISPLKK
ncbi:hypothetical protein [Halobacillus litoralis]|nr:hypothetical protein [Halobacillus litoralis]